MIASLRGDDGSPYSSPRRNTSQPRAGRTRTSPSSSPWTVVRWFVGSVTHLLWSPGTGKGHLAIALGVEAVRAGKIMYMATLAELVDSMRRAERGGAPRRPGALPEPLQPANRRRDQ